MKILNVKQGTPEWLALRSAHLCASDAPAMMGASPYTKRTEYIRMKATGDEKEFSDWEQKNLLDKGHQVEVPGRAFAEEMLGEALYPVTGSDDEGRFLASFDGITMDGETSFECKLWNEDLAAAVRAGDVPSTHWPQLEQQIIVGGLARVIFVVTDGTPEKRVHLEYRSHPDRAKALLASWKQAEEDIKNYVHVEAPAPVRGRVIPALPALNLVLSGRVTKSNLAEFKAIATEAIEGINTVLKTDQDFADAMNMVTFLKDAEDKLNLTKEQALSHTVTIDEAFRTIDDVREQCRSKRLELDKLVEAEKKKRRDEILQEGQKALGVYLVGVMQRLGVKSMPPVSADFAGAMKGKKTIVSLRDAVNTTLAQAKIAATELADKIDRNLKTLRAAGDYGFLFADLEQVFAKEPEDFALLVQSRIAQHTQREEQQRAAALATTSAGPAKMVEVQGFAAPNVVSLRQPQRPSDAEMVNVIAAHYRVPPAVAAEWLRTFDYASIAMGLTNLLKGA